MLNKEKYIISCNKKGFVSLDDLQLMSYPISILITIYNENSKGSKKCKATQMCKKKLFINTKMKIRFFNETICLHFLIWLLFNGKAKASQRDAAVF